MGNNKKTTRKTPPPVKQEDCILEEVKHIEHEVVEHVEKAVERIEEEFEHLFHHHHPRRTTSIAIISFGDTTMNDITLLVGQSTIGTIVPLEADGVTQTPGAVASAQAFSIPPDPSFGAVDNGDGTLTITGNAPSAATVTGTATATVTDADGTVNSFTQPFTITVNGVTPPTERTASIGVSFSTPA